MERIHTTTTTTRKLKWQYPQAVPSTPRILHLPRRFSVRRNSPKTKTPLPSSQKDERQRLEVLFEQERSFDRRRSPPAIVVVNDAPEERGSGGGFPVAEAEEAKWRFQAEMLRAECNLLRMEKEIAVKKMERRREKMERTLRSAVHSLLFGKHRISGGENADKVLEQEISYLVGKLHQLSSKPRKMEARACRHNFDKQASVLRRRLEKLDEVSEEMCVKEIREMAEATFSVRTASPVDHHTGNANEENEECSRQCKAIVRRIAEEMRAEAEQWSQMQEMLRQVREKMEELQASRDFWQDRALVSDPQIQTLRSTVQEWRKRASSSEAKAKCLEEEVQALRCELERARKDHNSSEAEVGGFPSETEKRVLICRLKENRHTNNSDHHHRSNHETIHHGTRTRTRTETSSSRSRMPLRDIRNRS